MELRVDGIVGRWNCWLMELRVDGITDRWNYGSIESHVANSPFFQVLFLTVGLALFASAIPEIIELLGQRSKYGGAFKNERG